MSLISGSRAGAGSSLRSSPSRGSGCRSSSHVVQEEEEVLVLVLVLVVPVILDCGIFFFFSSLFYVAQARQRGRWWGGVCIKEVRIQ